MLRVPFFRHHALPGSGGSGESFVFRDFEHSRIALIREAVARRPVLSTIFYVLVVATWTALLSAGAGLHGNDSLAVNLTPHVAHFTIVLGFFFYPLKRIWVPIAVYVATFLYPFYQPFAASIHWHDLPGMSAGLIASLFALHLGSGLLVGLLCRIAYTVSRTRIRPHSLDLFISLVCYVIFVTVCLGQMLAMQKVALSIPAADWPLYGFGDGYVSRSINRIIRGGVVVSAFMLLAVEYPRPGQYLRTLMLALVFPVMVALQAGGIVLDPQLDVIIVALAICLTNPAGVGIYACTLGVATYVAMTGQFLNDSLSPDTTERIFTGYSLLGLTLLALTMVLKGQSDHANTEKDAAIRKLDRARDFAGVGLFAVNQQSRRFRLDDAAQRMLGLPSDGPLSVFVASFMPEDRKALIKAFGGSAGQSRTFTLRMASAAGAANVLRCYLWAEPTPNGDHAAYGILLDITEAEDREGRLKDTLAELSSRQEKQRQLFSIISHELRTPASVISLLTDDMGEADQSLAHRQLREATDQLLSVLDDMRQAVNPEKNLPVKLVPYIPAELAESVRNAMDLTARDKGIGIRVALGAGAAQARIGDVVRVRQALTNLVRNAVIHSGGNTVTISWAAAAPAADFMPVTEWRVEDDGVGIPESEVARLFEPFERGGKDPRKSADGSGLGLYIARASIQMLGGDLTHYRPETGGAGYVIRLPEAVATQPPKPQEKKPEPAAQNRWSVVLAEDNALVAEITRARLEKLNATVHHAGDGRVALKMVTDLRPDVVITDLFMPEMDGDDLIRTLREQGYDRPIIGLTAAVVGEEMARFRAAGANTVMKKPLDFEVLRGFLRDGFPAPVPAQG